MNVHFILEFMAHLNNFPLQLERLCKLRNFHQLLFSNFYWSDSRANNGNYHWSRRLRKVILMQQRITYPILMMDVVQNILDANELLV